MRKRKFLSDKQCVIKDHGIYLSKKQMKHALKQLYAAPKPVGKDEFLRRFDKQIARQEVLHMRLFDFMKVQIKYIRVWNYLLSVVILAAALFSALYAGTGKFALYEKMLWVLAATVPYLALSTVTEMNRSSQCGMSELEMATRFSLKSVIMARLAILGGGNLLVLGIIAPVISLWQRDAQIFKGFYVLVPYFMAAFLNLWIVRNIRSKENLYICGGVTVMISFGCIFTQNVPAAAAFLQEAARGSLWLLVFVMLLILTFRECMMMVKENFVWS